MVLEAFLYASCGLLAAESDLVDLVRQIRQIEQGL